MSNGAAETAACAVAAAPQWWQAPPMDSADSPDDASDDRRLAMRLSVGYFLRFIEVLQEVSGRNLIQSILLLAVLGANVGALDSDPAASRQFAGLAAVPPDELRRPISIYAIAQSLGLPYETVRRQIHKMIDRGIFRRVGDGIIVPSEVIQSPQMMRSVERNYQNLKTLMRGLNRAGIDFD